MKAKLKTLKNGLRIITVPMKDNPTATVMVMVEAGTRYETKENNGLSHFLEHMCFKGTQKRNSKQIAYELDVSEATIKAHVTAIFRKLGVQNRTQAVLAISALNIEDKKM